ncbi:nitroreductase [Thermodesulfobacteriota bacterium]
MGAKEAITKRKSIRAYKKDPVAKEVLQEILEIAVRAPSGMNTQPWEVTVVAGQALDDIRNGNIESLSSGKTPASDFGPGEAYDGVYKQRQRDLAMDLYGLLGIGREDKQKRMEWTMHGFRAFEAPALMILCVDESLDARSACSDVGGLVQTICLAAMDFGLGTCINGQSIWFPEVVRKVTGIPESKKIAISIAIGYPDWDHPSNKLESKRESIENIISWCGFE